MRLLSLFLLLGITVTTNAQVRNVVVTGGSEPSQFEQQVVSALTTRLMATTKFKVTKPVQAELEIRLVCISMTEAKVDVVGGVCSYAVEYYPQQLAGLGSIVSGLGIMANGLPSEMGEQIFQTFVKDCTDEALKGTYELMLASIDVIETRDIAIPKPQSK